MEAKSAYFSVMLVATLGAVSAPSEANWFGFGEPKSLEDCLLKHVDKGMSDAAVNAIIYSCSEKFPSESDKSHSKNKKLLEKCRLSSVKPGTQIYLYNQRDAKPAARDTVQGVANNVVIEEFEPVNGKLKIHNKSSMNLGGLAIGFTKTKTCPDELKAYAAISHCSAVQSGINALGYGAMQCQEIPKSARKLGYCVVGFTPRYDRFDLTTLAKILDDRNLCEP